LTTASVTRHIERLIVPRLEQLPVISYYAKIRGWPYVLSWIHRITGIMLVLYMLIHVYTLSFLRAPEAYDAKMRLLRLPVFVMLEWALAIPVIFHALNGGRLLLYEIFGVRKDEAMIRWVFGLSSLYVLLLGLMMVCGSQRVTPVFYWLTTLLAACILGYVIYTRIWKTDITLGWKLQRISGGFLLMMIPAHMLFMHLNLSMGHEAGVVIARMQNIFIKIVDITLVISVLFHGGYGLLSIAKDYVFSKWLKTLFKAAVCAVMVFFGWIGTKLVILI